MRPRCLDLPIDAQNGCEATALALTPARTARTLFTMNLDHAATMESDSEFADAYAEANVRVVDGWPVSVLHWAYDGWFPHRVAGADLFVDVLAEASTRGLSIFLLGSAPDRLDAAVQRMRARWPAIDIAGQLSPPRMALADEARDAEILAAIASSRAAVVFVLFGAPTSELWLHRNRERLPVANYLCLGAAADFFGGSSSRAPRSVAILGFEWLWRMLHEPRRLAPRYLRRDLPFFLRSLVAAFPVGRARG